MTKEITDITDIMAGIHQYFSEYNRFVSAETGLSTAELSDTINAVNNTTFRACLNKCDYVIEKNMEGDQCIAKIVLPEIQVPELKLSLCKKTITLEDTKINEICEKFKAMFKMRYFIEDDEISYYNVEDEEWNKIPLRESSTKKKIEAVGEKIKTAANTTVNKVNKQKKVMEDLQENMMDTLKKVINKIEVALPCLLIRNNKINIGIEVKYPASYDAIINKVLLLAQKASMAEILKVIMSEMLEVVTDVKINLQEILAEAIKAGVLAFKETLISTLKLINVSDMNYDYITCNGINESKCGKWIELKSDLSKSILNK